MKPSENWASKADRTGSGYRHAAASAARLFMNRTFPVVLLALTLACAGCGKIKLPKFGKAAPPPAAEQPVAATPVPAALTETQAPAPASHPPAAPGKVEPNTHAAVMVLCYHRFEDRPKDSLAITPAEFEKELGELKEAGFSVIPMQDFLAWRRGEKNIPDKSCVITIDDGYRSGYDVAWPILKKHGFPFTMFIYTNYVKGQPNAGGQSMTWEELAEMRDAGVDIQSHTVSHTNLREKRGKYQNAFPTHEEWLRHEMAGSKKMLQEKLGIAVNCLAYPYGNHNEEIRKMAMECGYEAAFSVYGQRIGYNSPADQLGRYAVDSKAPKVFQDALKMIGGGAGGGESPAISQAAAASMLTEPMEGETISDPQPVLKANLAVLGDLDPESVEVRVSGIGPVAAKYDPETKLVEARLTQKLKDSAYTVIVTAKSKGRKLQTSWTFNYAPAGAQAPEAVPAVAAPVEKPAAKPAKGSRR